MHLCNCSEACDPHRSSIALLDLLSTLMPSSGAQPYHAPQYGTLSGWQGLHSGFSEELYLLFPYRVQVGEEGQIEIRILPGNHANTRV